MKLDCDPEAVTAFFEWAGTELDAGSLLTLSEPLPYRWLVTGGDYRLEGETYITTELLRARLATTN